MRSCVYCGKSLERGEVCDCPQSIRMRGAKDKASDSYWSNQENVYTTGYTSEVKKKKNRITFKKPDISKLKYIILRYIKDPVGAVFEIKEKNLVKLGLLGVILGCIISASFLFVSGAGILGAGNFGRLFLWTWLGVILFIVLLTGVFSVINKLILKQNVNQFRLATRLVGAMIPLSCLCILSSILSIFPGFADVIILLAGVVMYFITIYEVLRCEWKFLKASQIVYLMTAGISMLLVFLLNFVRI